MSALPLKADISLPSPRRGTSIVVTPLTWRESLFVICLMHRNRGKIRLVAWRTHCAGLGDFRIPRMSGHSVAIFWIRLTETQLISARMSARRPTKEVDAEQGFGVMNRFPHCALVRGYVLNNLENGPARVADLVRRGQAEFGFSHGEIEAAAKHFAVVTQVKRGQIFWMRPANLFAIWWGLTRNPNRSRGTAAQR